MFKNFNKERIKKVFLKRRGFSSKTKNFWEFIFSIKNKSDISPRDIELRGNKFMRDNTRGKNAGF